MSVENLPEIYAISRSTPPQEWAVALTNSDTISSLLNRIDWTKSGRMRSSLPPEDLSLRGVLEQMP